MAIWSISLDSKKKTLMEVRDSPHENVIFWNVTSTSRDQIYNMMNTMSLMREK